MKPKGVLDFPIANRLKKLWDAWNVRAFILFSLSLQAFLILFAPFRKRTANNFMVMLIWSGYLLADWAASFAVGLISSGQGDTSGPKDNGDLLAFWATFLLLHLGGPDTITAFALEDNELWLRHLLGLLFQVIATAYVFARSLPENQLWIPTVLTFIAGIIKYAERTRALYLASLNSFRESMLKEPDPGPNYAKLMDEYFSKKEAGLPTRIEMRSEPDKEFKVTNFADQQERDLNELKVVQHAYHYFKIFKGLIVDIIFSFRERNESREFFSKRNATDAFRVIEVELNFIYEVLYSKVAVVHCKVGYFFRFISFSSVVAALTLFHSQEKHGFQKVDIRITYSLLLGAIALDTLALIMLIFSDRTVASLKSEKKHVKYFADILERVLNFKRSRRNENTTNPCTKCLVFAKRLLCRRWSESVAAYNLIQYCLKESPERNDKVPNCLGLKYFLCEIKSKIIAYLGIQDFLDLILYVSREQFTDDLRNFIFKELLSKSKIADDPETAKEISSARGVWVLRNRTNTSSTTALLQWIDDVSYDESLLLWHIATELCLNTEEDEKDSSEERQAEKDSLEEERKRCKRICKLLSDYMLYLLVMQPTMMSAVAGIGQIRFRDTCAETKKFFSRMDRCDHKTTCVNILAVNTDVKPVDVKGDRSKSVLFDACMLAKGLQKLKGEKWEIMSEVWVELLSYAASHCRANTHAQLLSKGGELVTFVWLLMAHLGLGEQFQIKEGHARAKLLVGK